MSFAIWALTLSHLLHAQAFNCDFYRQRLEKDFSPWAVVEMRENLNLLNWLEKTLPDCKNPKPPFHRFAITQWWDDANEFFIYEVLTASSFNGRVAVKTPSGDRVSIQDPVSSFALKDRKLLQNLSGHFPTSGKYTLSWGQEKTDSLTVPICLDPMAKARVLKAQVSSLEKNRFRLRIDIERSRCGRSSDLRHLSLAAFEHAPSGPALWSRESDILTHKDNWSEEFVIELNTKSELKMLRFLSLI